MSVRRRLDLELVRRGIVANRQDTCVVVEAGRVVVGGAPALNAAHLVAASEPIGLLRPARRFVSRGGDKLDAGLERFGIAVEGRSGLDVGASTGGFTDCLLQRGASSVTSVDVGHGQLHQRVGDDARVIVRERCNARRLRDDGISGPFDVVVADLSFISLTKVIGELVAVGGPAADVVLLVKPQFEADRSEVSRGRGVIVDPAIWRRTLSEVCRAVLLTGSVIMGLMPSPLRGADGNVEFLLHLTTPARSTSEGVDPQAVASPDPALLDGAIGEVTAVAADETLERRAD